MSDEHTEEHESLATGGGEPIEDRPVPATTLATAREGLEPGMRPGKSAIVIGAGMATSVARSAITTASPAG